MRENWNSSPQLRRGGCAPKKNRECILNCADGVVLFELWNHPSHDLHCVSIMLPSLVRRANSFLEISSPKRGSPNFPNFSTGLVGQFHVHLDRQRPLPLVLEPQKRLAAAPGRLLLLRKRG